jgi:hypothetical protein
MAAPMSDSSRQVAEVSSLPKGSKHMRRPHIAPFFGQDGLIPFMFAIKGGGEYSLCILANLFMPSSWPMIKDWRIIGRTRNTLAALA